MLRASLALDELERVDQLKTDGEDLRLAGRIGLAVNAPKELHGEQQRFKGALSLTRTHRGNPETEGVMARNIQRALRISRRRAREARRAKLAKG